MPDEKKAVENLDIRCAKLGEKVAEEMDEKKINQALSVLEQQGPYAMFLFVRAQHESVALKFEEACKEHLLNGEIFNALVNEVSENTLERVEKLAKNLDDLLFAKDLLRTALSYARFYYKAEDEKR